MPKREVDMDSPLPPVETVENQDLVASDRVEGADVYGTDRQKVGSVNNFMVSKRTGKVAHVIISDGGFFGLGGTHFMTVPWEDLTYDEGLGGYVAHITKDIMKERGRMSTEDAELQIW